MSRYGCSGYCGPMGPCICGEDDPPLAFGASDPSCKRKHVDIEDEDNVREFDPYHPSTFYSPYRRRLRAHEEQRPVNGCCPKCGSKVVNRENHTTKNKFTGCSSFPTCRWTCNGHTQINAQETPKPVKPKVVHLTVHSRKECPFRSYVDYETHDWGPAVDTCAHPLREKRKGDPWCPSKTKQRTDDPTPELTPFPPNCPLRNNDKM